MYKQKLEKLIQIQPGTIKIKKETVY